jgi:hypothetical protein
MYTVTNVTKTGKALFLATNSRYPYGDMDTRPKDGPRAAPVPTDFEDVAYGFPNPTAPRLFCMIASTPPCGACSTRPVSLPETRPQSDAINADWIERFKREDAAG